MLLNGGNHKEGATKEIKWSATVSGPSLVTKKTRPAKTARTSASKKTRVVKFLLSIDLNLYVMVTLPLAVFFFELFLEFSNFPITPLILSMKMF